MLRDRIERLRGLDRQDIREYLEWVWRYTKEPEQDYWLARFLILRLLGVVYVAAFASLLLQLGPLLGSDGLTPVSAQMTADPSLGLMLDNPSLLWISQADWFLYALAGLGLVLSVFLLVGFANVPLLVVNWAVYLSFVNTGYPWYSYGWEIQLVETGFLAVFLVPLLDPRPFSRKLGPPAPVVWLFRWIAVRVNLGSGLIKLKGSACWQELTCLDRFFYTQPIPNPVSPWMNAVPSPVAKLGVLYTHIVQIVAPYAAFFEDQNRRLRIGGGLLLLSLQFGLILVGNFAVLNWLTIVAIIAFFDDAFLSRVLPSFLVERARAAKEEVRAVSDLRHGVHLALVVFVALMSVPIVVNMAAPTQTMNMALNDWNLVNSYGAFGGIRPERTELVIEGTRDKDLSDARWREYDVPHKPDQVDDPLTQVAPYQPRLSWQLWFASMSTPGREPWLRHLVWKLLHNDEQGLALMEDNPFPEGPPAHIRIQRYRFEMQGPLAGDNWDREMLGTWYGPVSVQNRSVRVFSGR